MFQHSTICQGQSGRKIDHFRLFPINSLGFSEFLENGRYLRHFECRSALHGMNRTGSFRYMSEETSEGAQLQGYMLECVRRTETQRIRTATNFLRRSAGSSEDTLHSSVTNVADFRVLQTSHSPLKIGGKTLSLSIAAKKCTVVAWQRRLQAAVDLTSRRCVFLNFFIWGLGVAMRNFGT